MSFGLVFYTNLFVPKRFAGITLGFIILIRPEHKNSKDIIAHEWVHVRQFWKNPLFPILYLLSPKFRLKSEVEAYRESIATIGKQHAWAFARHLSSGYKLDISPEEALRLLMEE